jgi:hypothetical protein
VNRLLGLGPESRAASRPAAYRLIESRSANSLSHMACLPKEGPMQGEAKVCCELVFL